MKVRQVERILSKHGFVRDRQTGGHSQYKRSVKNGGTKLVTLVGRRGDDIPNGTLANIRRQSGLPRRLFR
ncbi:MAG: type II toxin-antitoxin system HicA family toxin [Bryobacterales bacterium]|nr:type II toxin-antitoxin system HicA family toxin [Bryobacterales bacterium]